MISLNRVPAPILGSATTEKEYGITNYSFGKPDRLALQGYLSTSGREHANAKLHANLGDPHRVTVTDCMESASFLALDVEVGDPCNSVQSITAFLTEEQAREVVAKLSEALSTEA